MVLTLHNTSPCFPNHCLTSKTSSGNLLLCAGLWLTGSRVRLRSSTDCIPSSKNTTCYIPPEHMVRSPTGTLRYLFPPRPRRSYLTCHVHVDFSYNCTMKLTVDIQVQTHDSLFLPWGGVPEELPFPFLQMASQQVPGHGKVQCTALPGGRESKATWEMWAWGPQFLQVPRS